MGRSEGRIFAAILRDVADNDCVRGRVSLSVRGRVSLRTIAGVWLALLTCFIALALRASTGEVLGTDVTLERWVQSLPAVVGDVLSLANWFGNGPAISIVTLAAAALLIYRRDLPAAAVVLLTYVPRVFNDLAKEVVSEPRPDPKLVRVGFPHDNLSFPSGHVVGITVALGLIFFIAPRFSGSRYVVYTIRAVCLFFVATVGLARVWLGAHWPSDTLGGYIYASLFLIPALVWLQRHPAGAAASEADCVQLGA
jgi:membrane-associated phospholipid phosphatase